MKNFSVFLETKKWCEINQLPCSAIASTTSTNDLAKAEALTLDNPVKIYLTDQQTAGRGRSTHHWANSPEGCSLLITWSLTCPKSPQAITAPLIGLALYKSLTETFGAERLSIKPPNDIYLDDKKILGILVETVQAGDRIRLIVGIGLNVFGHPPSVDIAGHLSTSKRVTVETWSEWLAKAYDELVEASRAAMAPHMTTTQREQLLIALNARPGLHHPYSSVSPFGDLTYNQNTISWRDL